MQDLIPLIAQHGVLLVFGAVLVEQLGAPLPAVPVMIVAGALAATGDLPLAAVFAAAVAASVVADTVWYLAGRRTGRGILALLCRISLSPDSCVRQTENVFARWGPGCLVFAKFVPGLSTVAPPLAGAMRLRFWPFQFFNGVGAALWAAAAIVPGWVFAGEIDAVLGWLGRMGGAAAVLFGVVLGLWIAWKAWDRARFLRSLRAARVSVDELYRMLERGDRPVVLDVRSQVARDLDRRRIPGARAVDPAAPDDHLGRVPRESEIVVYCS